MSATQENLNDGGLVAFQNRILGKIADRQNQENINANQWLACFIEKHLYFIPLDNVKEVIHPPSKYLGLSGWVHDGIIGGIQHKDDVWVVFSGVKCFEERAHQSGFPWDYRLLNFKPEEVGGNISLAIDRVVGLVAASDAKSNQERVNGLQLVKVKDLSGVLLDPVEWAKAQEISNIMIKE